MAYLKAYNEQFVIEHYKSVLEDKSTRFSIGMWRSIHAKEAAASCIRYLIEDILNYTPEQVIKTFNYSLLRTYKLSGILSYVFSSPYEALAYTFPEQYQKWEFYQLPVSYWTDTTVSDAVKFLIVTRLKWSRADVCEKLSRDTFLNNKIGAILTNYTVSSALELAFPGEYTLNELEHNATEYWNKTDISVPVHRLCSHVLNLSPKQARSRLKRSDLINHGLGKMLEVYNLREILDMTYPYHECLSYNTPTLHNSYTSSKRQKKSPLDCSLENALATKVHDYVVGELGWDFDKAVTRLTFKMLYDKGFGELLGCVSLSTIPELLNLAFTKRAS